MKTILFLVLVIFVNSAHAGWVRNISIANVRASDNGNVRFDTSDGISNPSGCQSSDHYLIAASRMNPNQALAVLLTAVAMQRTVDIYVVEDSCGHTGRPMVRDVSFGRI